MKKISVLLLFAWLSAALLIARGNKEDSTQNIQFKIAHNLAADHPWGQALEQLAKQLANDSEQTMSAKIFHNATLGSDIELLEQLQQGIIDIVRASAATLANLDPAYIAFTLPYLFESEEQFYQKTRTITDNHLFDAAADNGMITLGAFNGGIRSFYTAKTPIGHPRDLKGLKIRVIGNPTQIKMLELLGGTPVPMAYGEIYTALQQGILDGAENNPTALTLSRHGEVAKFYSYDRHGFIPDFIVIGTITWKRLTAAQQKIVQSAVQSIIPYHREIWNAAVKKSKQEAEAMGVQFSEPDQTPFREAVAPIYDEYRSDPEVAKYLDMIQN